MKKILSVLGGLLLIGSANAAQIASTNYVQNAVAPKANLEVTGTAGSIATVDATGQYVRSGILATDITTAITNVNTAITDLDGKADKTIPTTAGNIAGLDATGNLIDSGVSAADLGAMTGDISGKADKVESGVTGNLTELSADGNYADTGISATDVATTITNVTTMGDEIDDLTTTVNTINTNITNADLTTVEHTTNRVDTITGTTPNTAYPSVGALKSYVLPIPPAACATTQCVLSVNGAGNPYWETVVLATP